jgi:hypothetical protein
MSSIVTAARDLLAIISPMTGTRATGVVHVHATAAKSGTYTWVANVVTVTCAAHGHSVDDIVTLDFTSGDGTPDGNYTVVTVPGTGSFTVALTGAGAGGNVTIGQNVRVYEGEYAIPVLGSSYRDDLVIKVGAGPNTATDGRTYWLVASAGTDVTFKSNLGGVRHNTIVLPTTGDTVIAFDPPLDNIVSAVLKTNFTGGLDASGLGWLRDAFMYEQFEGDPTDLGRSNLNQLPGVLIVWKGSDAADGSSVSQVSRMRMSSTQTMMKETFDLMIFVERAESDHLRRLQGLYLSDLAAGFLTDRVMIDGNVVSSPSGVQVQRRFKLGIRNPEGYINTYAYGMTLSVMRPYVMTDMRTFTDLNTFVLDMVKPFTVAEGGDIPVVGDGLPGDPGLKFSNT